MGRMENIGIFEDTRRLWETERTLCDAVAYGRAHQEFIPGAAPYTARTDARRGEAIRLTVSKRRTLEAAALYPGRRVCVMNFASATNPGGGVTRGSSAQEEALCRCSTLYPCLDSRAMWDAFYTPHRRTGDPLHNDDCIYTPDVVVFKSDTAAPTLLPEEAWYRVDVLTCAAPNLRDCPANEMNPGDGAAAARIGRRALRELHARRLRRVLDVAAGHGAEVLILGAFGCGAFRNPPDVVAAAMRDALREHRNSFEAVELAVFTRPGREENYLAFEAAFAGWR